MIHKDAIAAGVMEKLFTLKSTNLMSTSNNLHAPMISTCRKNKYRKSHPDRVSASQQKYKKCNPDKVAKSKETYRQSKFQP